MITYVTCVLCLYQEYAALNIRFTNYGFGKIPSTNFPHTRKEFILFCILNGTQMNYTVEFKNGIRSALPNRDLAKRVAILYVLPTTNFRKFLFEKQFERLPQ